MALRASLFSVSALAAVSCLSVGLAFAQWVEEPVLPPGYVEEPDFPPEGPLPATPGVLAVAPIGPLVRAPDARDLLMDCIDMNFTDCFRLWRPPPPREPDYGIGSEQGGSGEGDGTGTRAAIGSDPTQGPANPRQDGFSPGTGRGQPKPAAPAPDDAAPTIPEGTGNVNETYRTGVIKPGEKTDGKPPPLGPKTAGNTPSGQRQPARGGPLVGEPPPRDTAADRQTYDALMRALKDVGLQDKLQLPPPDADGTTTLVPTQKRP